MAVTAVYGGRAQPSFILQVSDAWKAGGGARDGQGQRGVTAEILMARFFCC
ncbi:hypothetical protein ES319_A01G026800v1 [Gossypium barbadense]|uniref:Uncharacterized protein n=1 Tax=Gossypium barbadense TaxID=3634 RepID=A0A5J5WVM0_GOSBA|nr:hypothetical protein ES319_A01G026800v1 [Gossypium barbadense]